MNRNKILIVEDDFELRKILADVFSSEYEVVTAADFHEGRQNAVMHAPDVILLDVRLPGGSGLDLCRIFRENASTCHSKVIMITGQLESETIVRAFDSGADDYITKPFRIEELKARVNSKIRRIKEKGPVSREFGNLTLAADRLLFSVDGEEFRLSTLEFSLLEFFIRNGEKIACRKQILRNVWQGSVVSDRTVDAHIVSLRRKLIRFDHEIVTIYGAGYALKRKCPQHLEAKTEPSGSFKESPTGF